MSSNESRKSAAREFQAANPGTSYTRALRQVSHGDQRRPLSAVLGTGPDGASVSVNLEWESQGGSGPHCLIAGAEVPALLAVLAAGLASGQRQGDLELVLCASDATQVTVDHRRVGADELVEHVNDVLRSRHEVLRSVEARDVAEARERGHQVPTTVVLIEDLDGQWGASAAVGRWVRIGRSSGVNVVLGSPAASPSIWADDMSPAHVLDRLARAALADDAAFMNATTAAIFGLGDGRATLRMLGRWNPGRRVREADTLTDFTFAAPQ
ncbi:MAG: hypothetical protein CK429_32705 [Mycobacterium sp.]|nr:MAG: hypothetical protein CK429_32705 [Mycobacterium sp.]